MIFAIDNAAASTDWSALGAWSTLGAAVVTAVTAVLIYLQIRQTRKSVVATTKAVEAAQLQAEAAQRSISEGQRALISSQIPKLTVRVTQQPAEVWRYTTGPSYLHTSRKQLVPGEDSWNMPGDAGVQLALNYQVEIANDGPGRADVQVIYSLEGMPRTEHLVLLVGEARSFETLRVETLEEWIRLHWKYYPEASSSDEGESDRE